MIATSELLRERLAAREGEETEAAADSRADTSSQQLCARTRGTSGGRDGEAQARGSAELPRTTVAFVVVVATPSIAMAVAAAEAIVVAAASIAPVAAAASEMSSAGGRAAGATPEPSEGLRPTPHDVAATAASASALLPKLPK